MKRFTQRLPEVLEKLEIIRQVLEVHGIVPPADQWKPLPIDGPGNGLALGWTWRRGNVVLNATFYLDGGDGTSSHGVELRLERLGDGWVNLIGYVEEYQWLIDFERHSDVGLDDMWYGLPEGDISKDHYSDIAAREVMGMIAAFFAKLPDDAAKVA